MSEMEQRTAAAKFARDWHGRGNEKSDTQLFWGSLLAKVFDVRDVEAFIQFEKSVERLGHAGYIDAYIPSTKTLIEQKSLGIDLDKAFTQAKEYADYLPLSQKPRWIVVSDFATFRVHDMEKPLAAPEVIELKNLAKEAHRLKFLVDSGSAALKREEEISLAAGRIIGELYDEFLKLYGESPSEADLRNLNVLCVRIVFCLYAEDAGILPKNAFHDYLNKFVSSDIRVAMRDFFDTLNTPPEERGRFLDPDLARLPYVNGGLFGEGKERNTEILRHGEGRGNQGDEAFGFVGEKFLTTKPEASSPCLSVSPSLRVSITEPHPHFDIPPFSTAMRQLLLQKASLNFDWSAISPTIFGAVFESTLNPETRRKGGMHYTSVENIHKVIDPLFLDALWREFGEIVGEESISRKAAKAQRQGDEASGFVKRGKGYSPCTKPEASSPWSVPLHEAGGFVSLGARLCARNLSVFAPSRVIDKKTRARLLTFQSKLSSLTFLDPACGSGNFLTETYLSLRRLENEVLKILLNGEAQFDLGDLVRVNIRQFYGIEINDFAVTVAKTALWIAESQMLKETEDILHRSLDFLPLKTYSNIVEANALTLDWETVVPRDRLSYIIGNPPFVGYSLQSKEQKENVLSVYVDERGKPYKTAGKIDFVACWYFKACQLMQGTNIRAALVSTNSICQGEQVAAVWKPLIERFGLRIDFAWRTFRWDSESLGMAHVHCVIVGFSCGGGDVSRKAAKAQRQGNEASGFVKREKSDSSLTKPEASSPWSVPLHEAGGFVSLGARLCARNLSAFAPSREKIIFDEQNRPHPAANINPYLIDAPDVFVESRSKPLCAVPEMASGGKPVEGGHLIFTDAEHDDFLKIEPAAEKWFRRFTGSDDFINNRMRWCLWLKDCPPNELRAMRHVMERVAAVRDFRLASVKEATRKAAATPACFMEIKQPASDYILVPRVSSENRRYVPIGFVDKNIIASDATSFLPNATLYHFGVLTSSVHMAWMRAVCGRLKSDYRYSVNVVYNNFPWPQERNTEILRHREGRGNQGNEASGFVDEKFLTTKPEASSPWLSVSQDICVSVITQTAQAILDARARYPDASLADLYDDLTMPPDLRAAHEANDRAVMEAYGFPVLGEAASSRFNEEVSNPFEQAAGCRFSRSSGRMPLLPIKRQDVASPIKRQDAASPELPESAIVAELMKRYQALSARREEGTS